MNISLFLNAPLFTMICGLILIVFPGILLAYLILPGEQPILRIALGTGLSQVLLGWLLLLFSLLRIEIISINVIKSYLIFWILEILLIGIFWRFNYSKLFLMSKNLKILFKENSVAIFGLLIFLIILIIGLPIAQAINKKAYTEFYVAEGLRPLPPWRRTYNNGDNLFLNLVVNSNEKLEEIYYVRIFINGATYETINLGSLKPGQSIIKPVKFALSLYPTSLQRYDFVLYKGESTIPYRSLHFWINVANNQNISTSVSPIKYR